MSLKQNKNNIPTQKGNDKKKSGKPQPAGQYQRRGTIIINLYKNFQDCFDLPLIESVAHTCQWDIHRATEALTILAGRKGSASSTSKSKKKSGAKNKAKSLPGTLKQEKPDKKKGMNPEVPAHYSSTNSLSSGQVWQRHYKSKPQSPGLLTMIPPHSKEIVKLKNPTPNLKQTEVKKASETVNNIQKLVQSGVKVMILMRGLPGSGKTHLAQVIVSLVTGNEFSQHIFSTDDYFIMLGRGNYAYDFNQLDQAHNWNQKRVSEALKRGINPVVVDNTNSQSWEMRPYVFMAVEQGYSVEVLEPVTEWRNKEGELAKKNVHNVPREKIRQMSERFEPGWTGEKLLKSFGIKYKHGGAAKIFQPPKPPTNSLLAQHRQNAVVDVPEKPKRKRISAKKKDRHNVTGIEISEDKEKQLEELNKLFAEYGMTMDPSSRQKVLESGVHIPEVVSRMRKLQGNLLPMPKPTSSSATQEINNHPVFHDHNVIKPVPNYAVTHENSFSVDPDTMSSSNASETSECETDTDIDFPKWKEMAKYFKYGAPGRFVDGEDLQEDYDNEDQHSQVEKKELSSERSAKFQLSSSQEELSLLEFTTSGNTGTCSQEDLNVSEMESLRSISDSSSSSEEQETQMLSLQESLKDMLIDNTKKLEEAPRSSFTEEENEKRSSSLSKPTGVELSDSLLGVLGKRFETPTKTSLNMMNESVSLSDSVLQMLVKKYSSEEEVQSHNIATNKELSDSECKKSPDLEEFPLPSIPFSEVENNLNEKPYTAIIKPSSEKLTDWESSKGNKLEDIINSWDEVPSSKPRETDNAPKDPRTKNSLLGAIKKTGLTPRDKSPEELLRSVGLSWSSSPFNSSWEDVSKKSSDANSQLPKTQRKLVLKSDSSTNTVHTDFDLWMKNDNDYIKLEARSRNINQNYKEPETPMRSVPEVLMLDKSSMTIEAEDMETLLDESALDNLSGMFPNISKEYLSDILEKCKGNILWAVELLLETPQNLGNFSSQSLPEDNTVPAQNESIPEPDYSPLQKIISDGKKTIKRRKDRKGATNELSLLLKKQIEESIQINEDLYQDKTLFLKKLRHGEIEFGDEPIGFLPLEASVEGVVEESKEVEEPGEEEFEETIPMKLDTEFLNILTQKFGTSNSSTNGSNTGFVPVINIPICLAQQIYEFWVESVNKQVEEMEIAYEKMTDEDELFAMALQEQEFEYRQPNLNEIMSMELAMMLYRQDKVFCVNHTPDNTLPDSSSLTLPENIAAQMHEATPDTLATKLSKQLLFEAYPKMDKKMLLNLFESEGRSLHKTVDVLSSQENQSPLTVVAPEFLASHGKKLLEQAKSESLKKNIKIEKQPIIVVKEKSSEKEETAEDDILLLNPVEYRQKLAVLHHERNECYRKAQEAFRQKSFSVASYFSHMASLYKENIKELSKDPFPPTFLEDKKNKNAKKIDLHFLWVSEALQILDLFIDYHIKDLKRKSIQSVCLDLITGRGQHSVSGISKIKPAVKKRLTRRGLCFVEANPGMLKVMVHANDLLTEEI